MAQPQIARTDFAAAIAQIVKERNIPAESIYDAIEQALVSAYRKQKGELQDEYYYFAEVDSESGESKIYRCPVTERDEETEEILEWDEDEAVEVTPPGFGRIAAQTAKQVSTAENSRIRTRSHHQRLLRTARRGYQRQGSPYGATQRGTRPGQRSCLHATRRADAWRILQN